MQNTTQDVLRQDAKPMGIRKETRGRGAGLAFTASHAAVARVSLCADTGVSNTQVAFLPFHMTSCTVC